VKYNPANSLTNWSSGLLHHVIFSLYTNISEEHAVSDFRVEVRRVKMLMGYIGSGGGLDQRTLEARAVRASVNIYIYIYKIISK
jgi:hypothetical protein